MPGEDAHEEPNDGGVRGGDVGEDDHQTYQDGLTVGEPEGLVQRTGLGEISKESEHEKDLDLTNDNVLHDVVELPVAELVSQDGHNLLVVAAGLLLALILLFLVILFLFLFRHYFLPLLLFQEGVKQNDPLKLEEAIEIRVAMTGALGAFNNKQLVEREANGGGESLDISLQLSLRHRDILIKERSYQVRVDGHQEQSQYYSKHPQIDEEVVATPVDDLDDCSQDGSLDDLAHNELLDLILGIKTRSLFVEAVLLLQYEGAIDAEGEPCQGAEDTEVQGEHERDEDLTLSRIVAAGVDCLGGVAPEDPVAHEPNDASGQSLVEQSLN